MDSGQKFNAELDRLVICDDTLEPHDDILRATYGIGVKEIATGIQDAVRQ